MTAAHAHRVAGSDHQSLMAAWFGLRPSSARRCPRVVAGRRCLAHRYFRDGVARCACEQYEFPLWDHVRIWLDQAGRYVLTLEPYGANGANVAMLARAMRSLGLVVDVTARSPWSPGRTVLILIRRDEGPAAPISTKPQPWHCAECGRELGGRADHFLLDDSRVLCRRCYKTGSNDLCEQLEGVGQRAAISRIIADARREEGGR
jgi:hypothetical protein